MTRKTQSTPPELDAATRRVSELEAEMSSLPAQTIAARRAGDVAEWMRLTNRAEDLPAELDAARLALLPLELDAAWDNAERLHADELSISNDLAGARAKLGDLNTAATGNASDQVEAAKSVVAIREQQAVVAELTSRHEQARDATGAALHLVDRLEAAAADQLDAPPVPPATGLRSRPRPLTANVMVTAAEFGALAARIGELGDQEDRCLLLAGTVPPRWVAHRLGAHVYESQRDITIPTLEEVEAGARRQAEIDSLDLGVETRLTTGRRQHRQLNDHLESERAGRTQAQP